MDNEIWRGVFGHENAYMISNMGRVKSLPRKSRSRFPGQEIILKHTLNRQGYHTVKIANKTNFIHKLVAKAFIETVEGKKYVHHIDHNKNNNVVNNLMWVTASENIKFNYLTGGQVGKTNMKGKFGKDNPGSKKVAQLDLSGNIIKVHDGVSDAARSIKGQATHIVKVCKGKLKKHRGYRWQYA